MTDARALADEAVVHLDRLGAVILDDIGDGPSPRDLAASAAASRDAIAGLGVPALTQLTRLIAGVAESMVAGTTDWSPSLGGTLMAAVDDLRHLVGRADQFTDEDSEHLHHRAAELSIYVRVAREAGPTTDAAPHVVEPAPVESGNAESAPPTPIAPAALAPAPSGPPPVSPEPVSVVAQPVAVETAPKPAEIPASLPSAGAFPRAPDKTIVPISQLFYADQGPHIVSGGFPKAAGDKSELLGRGIEALESLLANPFAVPVSMGVTAVVPVETLLYSGRAALERAAEIRAQIRTSGGTASPATLDEIYDLIGLALKD